MANVLTEILERQVRKYGDREAIVTINKDGSRAMPLSYNSLLADATSLACALETLGIEPQQKIAVFSANRTEMIVTDFACYMNRAVPVSIYATSSDDQVEYIINDSGAKILFTGNPKQFEAAMRVAPRCPHLEHIVVYRGDVPDGAGEKTTTYASLLELGRKSSPLCHQAVEERRLASTETDIATLIYTSGTTGEPKGAVLPHRCFNAMARIHEERLKMISDRDTSLCFLPLSHIFEKAWTYFCITQGIHVSVNTDPKVIADTIKQVRPTCMCSVPRFWEKVYAGINEKIAGMGLIKKLFVRAGLRIGHKRNIEYARLGKKAPWLTEKLYRFFKKNLFKPVEKIVGIDKGNIFPTAGAPIDAKIVEFFRSMGVNMIVGYGLSETTATVTCFPETDYIIGSVGTVMPELEVRLADNGEILVKGPTVMDCYYNKEKETAEAFTPDGWFRTGDAGYFDEAGALVLTERLKDLFKTSNGKYIAPQAIESRLGGDQFIEQVAVVGESRKYVTAIIIPAFEALKEYARKKGIKFRSVDDLLHNSEIVKMLTQRIEKLQKGLPSFEQIKKFTLLPKAFTIESGELTNTLKIRRAIINKHYAKEIEKMYAA